MEVNSEVKFCNGLKGTVVEVWQNGCYVVEPKYPVKSIIPFGATRLTIDPKSGMPFGYSTSYGYQVVDIIPAKKSKTQRCKNVHAYGSFCPLKDIK